MGFILEHMQGVILMVSLLVIIFFPLKRFFGEDGSFTFKFIATIVAFIFITLEDARKFFLENFEKVNHYFFGIELFIFTSLLFFLEKELRTKLFLYVLYIEFLEILVNNKTILGILLNPQISDLFILLSIGLIEYYLMEIRVLEKLDDHF